MRNDFLDISPLDHENFVKEWFDNNFGKLCKYESKVRYIESTYDGEYEIDIKIKYEISGIDFILLVECKKHKNNIKREVAQILNEKKDFIGAHKSIICSTSQFQTGTLRYCKKHGIACIKMSPGETTFHTRSKNISINNNSLKLLGIPPVVGWLQTVEGKACIHSALVSIENLEYIREYIKS